MKISADSRSPNKAEAILAAATATFLQHGYAHTSMDRVALRAGVSKHTIYNHFGDKRGLFRALIEHMVLRHFALELTEPLPLHLPPAVVLKNIAQILLTLKEDPDYIAFLRLMIAESENFPDLSELYAQEVMKCGHDWFVAYANAHPQIHFTHPSRVAHIFFGAIAAHIIGQEILGAKRVIPIESAGFIDTLIEMVTTQGQHDKSSLP